MKTTRILGPKYMKPFDPRDIRELPPLNEIKMAWDNPLPHEDPLMDEERRLLSVAQYVRDYMEKQP